MMKKLQCIIVRIVIIMALVSCSGKRTDNTPITDMTEMVMSDSFSTYKNIEKIIYLFPSPTDVLLAIQDGGLVYAQGLLNSVEKSENYIIPNDQYLNLGIYISDLSYCALFDRIIDAKGYVKIINRMSNELKLSNEINSNFFEKVKKSNFSEDSMENISQEFFLNMVSNLEDNNRQNELAIITVGAYIECLYLSVNTVDKPSQQMKIVNKIAEQKHVFNNLYQYCLQHISNEELMESFSYINEINEAFKLFSEKKGDIIVNKKRKSYLEVSGGNTLDAKVDEFNAFKETITKIRISITK